MRSQASKRMAAVRLGGSSSASGIRLEEDGGREARRQFVGERDQTAPLLKPLFLIPFIIAEQAERILIARRRDGLRQLIHDALARVAIEKSLRAGKQSVELGDFGGKRRLVVLVLRLALDGLCAIRVGRPLLPFQHAGGQHAEARRAQCPAGIGGLDPTARPQHGMGDRQLMARCAAIHTGVVQNEIFDMHKLARHPQGTGRIEEMTALGKALPHWGACHPLIEPRQRIFRPGNGRKQRLEHCGINFVAHC